MVHVRQARPADGQAVEAVTAAAFAPLRRIYRPRPGVQWVRPAVVWRLVAVEGRRVVGTVRYVYDQDRLHLMGLAVAPGRRRRGVARALIEHAARLARRRGLWALSLYTVVQTGNVPIFERMGFRVVRQGPSPHDEASDGAPVGEAYLERPVPARTPRRRGAQP